MTPLLVLALSSMLGQERPLPVPSPRLENQPQPQPLSDLSGWFVASDPYGASAVLHIEPAGDGWSARVIAHPTTGAVGHTWCDISAAAERPERTEDGAKFITRGVSVDAGPRWTPPPPEASPSFGVSVYEREAIITDMGAGQTLCGPRSELTGVFSRIPD